MATQFAIEPQHSAIQNAKAAEFLIRQHMGLVKKIAWQVHRRVSSAMEIDDLIQTGMIALIEAARVYEDRGHAFSTYASLRIRGSMVDGLRRQAAQCRSAMAKRRAIETARSRFEHLHGRAPGDSELAHALGMDLTEFRIDASASAPVWHEPIDDLYSDRSMAFADESEGADSLFDRSRTQDAIAAGIRMLPEREAAVLQMYFVEERPLDEIGATLGVGAARVCQIKKAALDRLKGMLGARG
jgi:RNA polymerase sigma factor FliA